MAGFLFCVVKLRSEYCLIFKGERKMNNTPILDAHIDLYQVKLN